MAGLNDVVLFICGAECDKNVYDEAGIDECLKSNHTSACHIVKSHPERDEEASIDQQDADQELPSDLIRIVWHYDALACSWLHAVAMIHLQLSPVLEPSL